MISNKTELIRNGSCTRDRTARRLCLQALEDALHAVDPYRCTLSFLRVKDGQLQANGHFSTPLSRFGRILVLAVGKAGASMMRAAFEILGSQQIRGILVAPRGERAVAHDPRIHVFNAGHPIPDREGLRAGKIVLKAVQSMKADELLLCMISGGASALLVSPPPRVRLSDERRLTECLLMSKASIHEINTVRRHISTLKGGQLVEQCRASTIISLIISDVPGNCLADIGSGLTVEDPTTYQDAEEVLKTHNLWNKIPFQIRKHLTQGLRGQAQETPKPGTPSVSRVRNFIITDNTTACTAAKRALRANGVQAKILTSLAEMEAKQMGRLLADFATKYNGYQKTSFNPRAIILGGETTVEIKGKGKGGRNQESVLWAARGIASLNGTVVAALGTDGLDGNSKAAGALADGRTSLRARRKRLDPNMFLARNDSYSFFRTLNDSLVTGPTGTNVGDLYLMIKH